MHHKKGGVLMKFSFAKEMFRLLGRLCRIGNDFVRGLWAINKLDQPIISIFGGVKVKEEDEFGQAAFNLARNLAINGFSIITGGGSGIMVAANCGASSVNSSKKNYPPKTLGIGLHDIDQGFVNPCSAVYKTHYFFIRKWFLMRYSIAFVFFPGGFGTVDEFFELLNLIAFKMSKPCAVILIGKDYWEPLMDWYVNTAMKDELIGLPPHEAFVICDSTHEAFTNIMKTCKPITKTGQTNIMGR